MEALATWFQETLLPYGVWGILVLSLLDSSFVPMPVFIDLAIMGAAALSPANALGYGAAAVIGSTAGIMVFYGLARRGRRAAAERGGAKTAWAEDFLQRRGALALFVAAVMPAPFPFKAVLLAAGYLRQPIPSLIIGVGTGRILRFGAEAFLAARYGPEIIDAVRANGPLAGLIVAVFVLVAAVAFYKWRGSLSATS